MEFIFLLMSALVYFGAGIAIVTVFLLQHLKSKRRMIEYGKKIQQNSGRVLKKHKAYLLWKGDEVIPFIPDKNGMRRR